MREFAVTPTVQCEESSGISCIETAGCYKTPKAAEAELSALEGTLLLEARNAIVVESEKSAKVTPIERKTAQKSIWDRTGSKG